MRSVTGHKWRLSAPGIAGAAIVIIVAIAFATLKYLSSPEANPVARGHQIAVSLGCFSCHGPAGEHGIPNAGSQYDSVPSWSGGTAMMFVKNDEEVREWILNGKSKRAAQEAKENPEPDTAVLHMPAFRGRMGTGQLNDLLAYYKAVAEFGQKYTPEEKQGKEVAASKGCFGCHGPLGLGVAHADPGSFKGYIPGWAGSDYNDLVKSDAELREWIMTGKSKRLMRNPAARHYLTREVIKMPAFKNQVNPQELDSIVAYIKGLQEQYHRSQH